MNTLRAALAPGLIAGFFSIVTSGILMGGIFHRFQRETPESWKPEGGRSYLLSSLLHVFSAIAISIPTALHQVSTGGPHGLTELVYAYTSVANGNGSALIDYVVTAYAGVNPTLTQATAPTGASATLSGLRGGTTYTVHVVAHSACGVLETTGRLQRCSSGTIRSSVFRAPQDITKASALGAPS